MAKQKNNENNVAVTALSKEEGEMLLFISLTCGFKNITVSTDPRQTLELAKHQQFGLFVTQNDFVDMTGLTMMQTLRSTGKYGLEPHLFLIDPMSTEIMLVLVENNLTHALTKPYTSERIGLKLTHLWNEESNLSSFEVQFREAHSASRRSHENIHKDSVLRIQVCMERRLVALKCQCIVGLGGNDLPSYFALGTHGINGYKASFDIKGRQ